MPQRAENARRRAARVKAMPAGQDSRTHPSQVYGSPPFATMLGARKAPPLLQRANRCRTTQNGQCRLRIASRSELRQHRFATHRLV